ncbi:DUF5134 domain-containing protein [Nocardioides aquiterrae]|uniref:DUF5134 domain-containing protein n=1 Tax=Nocardioides aquiterrae TaxID=203799 RepID=A0ABP4F428_9ACTN
MAVVLAVLCGLAAAYCLARCVVPAWRATDHGAGVDAWHVVMGAGMVLMVLGYAGRTASALFAAGVLWCLWAVARRHATAAHARLGVALGLMTLMLVPMPASAAAPHGHGTSAGPSAFLLAVAVALGVAAVSAGRTVPASDLRGRLGLGCEVVMAVAMAWMAAAAL